MFFDKQTDDEFFSALEQNMKKTASFEDNLSTTRLNKVLGHLAYAAICLEQAGLRKEAQMIVVLKEICEDPAIDGLTPEKMLENLETKGWVFNSGDHDPDSCTTEDCSYCADGKEPQLSQGELKKLRKLLRSDKSDAMDTKKRIYSKCLTT